MPNDPAQYGGLGVVAIVATWLGRKIVQFRPMELRIVDPQSASRIEDLEARLHAHEATITELRVQLARLEPRS